MKWQVEVKYRSGMEHTTVVDDPALASDIAHTQMSDAEVYDSTASITLTPMPERNLGPSTD